MVLCDSKAWVRWWVKWRVGLEEGLGLGFREDGGPVWEVALAAGRGAGWLGSLLWTTVSR